MRVIAGRFRRRILKSLPGMSVRPTPDRLRESLFNILAGRVENSIFLDAYAGTGAVGIEALSRGASKAILIERRADALDVLRENLRVLAISSEEVQVLRGSALRLLAGTECTIAFLDPPYELTAEYGNAIPALDETGCQLAIAQHHSNFVLDNAYGPFQKTRTVKQGGNSLSFFERA